MATQTPTVAVDLAQLDALLQALRDQGAAIEELLEHDELRLAPSHAPILLRYLDASARTVNLARVMVSPSDHHRARLEVV